MSLASSIIIILTMSVGFIMTAQKNLYLVTNGWSIMNFYQIRLKRYPHLYIPKKGIVYALQSDQIIGERVEQNYNNYYPDADACFDIKNVNGKISSCLFVNQKAAKTLTERSQVKSLLKYGCLNPELEFKGK